VAKVPPGTKRVEVYLPLALAQRLDALLRSEALGRVPYGSYNAFFVQRTTEFFASARLPMGQYAGFPRDGWISGPTETVRAVATLLAPTRTTPDELDLAFPELNPLADGLSASDLDGDHDDEQQAAG